MFLCIWPQQYIGLQNDLLPNRVLVLINICLFCQSAAFKVSWNLNLLPMGWLLHILHNFTNLSKIPTQSPVHWMPTPASSVFSHNNNLS